MEYLRSWRAALRRWPVIAAAALATTALGALWASCGTATYAAQGNVTLRDNPYAGLTGEASPRLADAWIRSAGPGFLRSHAVLERAVKESLAAHFPSATQRETGEAVARIGAALAARMENHSNVMAVRYEDDRADRAVAVVNAVAHAFEALARERVAQGIEAEVKFLDRTVQELERKLGSVAQELQGLPPAALPKPLFDLEEEAHRAELAKLERAASAAKLETEALRVEIDLLAARLDRGPYGPPAPPDTSESDRLSRELEGARRELDELPPGSAEAARASRRIDQLRRRRDEASERELRQAEFAPFRALLEEIREKTIRRDRQAQAAAQLQAQAEEARKRLAKHREQRSAPAHADERKQHSQRRALEAELKRVEESIATLRARQAQLTTAQAAIPSPVERIDPARAAVAKVSVSFRALPFHLLLGLAIGSAAALFLGRLSTTVRSEEDVRRYVNLPILGTTPELPEDQRVLLRAPPRSAVAEIFGAVATIVECMSREEALKAILLTGSRPREGKSTSACNLAVALARGGARVALLDADLRRGVQHLFFVIPNEAGLSAYLQGSVETSEGAIRPTEVSTLSLLPSGPYPEDPIPFLRCERFKALLGELRDKFDYVIIDAPPVLDLADALILAPLSDGILLTLAAGETEKGEVTEAKRRLRAAGGKIRGCLLNRAPVRPRGYYYYGSEVEAE